MAQSKARFRIATVVLPFCLLALGGCQKKEKEQAAASAPLASASMPGQPAGPCGELASKLCGEAGEKSELCAAGKSLAKVLAESACSAAVADFAQTKQKMEAERKVCTALADRLCNDLGAATDSCTMVREQTPQFPRERCEELTKEYDKVLGELKDREAQNKPLPADVQARMAAKDAPSFGPENAKVTLVEFSDFQCPYCSRAAAVTQQIRTQYGDKVRFVFRQFPLDFHQQANLAAQASLAAHQQGKFWEYHDLLFQNQSALTRESLEQYAKQLDLNLASMKKALDGSSFKAAVDADLKLGKEVFVNGTPTLFVNGKRVQNPTDFATVAKVIDAALSA